MSVLALFGPTASGKTSVAEALAARISAELVSADAMQVYRGLPILTNQSKQPARLVAIWPLSHEATLGAYQELAHTAIDEILAAGRTPIVVGGTGLYLRAALAELALPPAPPAGARERWSEFYDERGGEAAHAELAVLDPDAAAAVHPNDRRRVIRALELVEVGASLRPQHDRLWTQESRHPTVVVGLDVAKETLERRIDERTEAMFGAGVEAEVRQALATQLSTTARKMIGLREVSEFPRAQAIEALALRTRRFAAYQRKWMRRIPGIVMIDANRPADEVADAILTDVVFKMARARQQLPARRSG